MQMPVMFGGECSDEFKEQIEHLGGHALGSDHIQALELMETIVPVFSKK